MHRIPSKSRTTIRSEAEKSMNPDRFLVLIIGRDSKLETAAIISRLVDRIGDLEEILRAAHEFNPLTSNLATWMDLRNRMAQALEDRSVKAEWN